MTTSRKSFLSFAVACIHCNKPIHELAIRENKSH